MNKISSFLRVVINPYNLFSVLRTFSVVKNPFQFLICFFLGTFPKGVCVRTPTGIFNIELRNHESLKTVFSIFVREDYKMSVEEQTVIDIGSNVGVSAVYFLSRNRLNRIVCVEPDPENTAVLVKNLAQFSGRYFCISEACSAENYGEISFYLSDDGKYNSLLKIPGLDSEMTVEVLPVSEIFNRATQMFPSDKFTIKIDIEGTEKEVLSAIPEEYAVLIDKIYAEALGVSECVLGNWRTQVRNGYVTILERESI
jgi:FkbM family methyltransferase